jgi:predicted RNA-binding protein with PUA-like domain
MSIRKSTTSRQSKTAVGKPPPARPAAPEKRAVSVTVAQKPVTPERTRGERQFWLLKTEPGTFSFDDLVKAPRSTTGWSGVRNFQARNFMRDGMRLGDGVFIYHSSTLEPAVIGLAEVVREGYPDPTAFEKDDPYFDPPSTREAPTWIQVDVRAVRPLKRPVALATLRRTTALTGMALLRKGNRLSVQPVTALEWAEICRLGDGGKAS